MELGFDGYELMSISSVSRDDLWLSLDARDEKTRIRWKCYVPVIGVCALKNVSDPADVLLYPVIIDSAGQVSIGEVGELEISKFRPKDVPVYS